jgi:prevent-host-death family protein
MEIGAYEAKTHFSELIKRAARGEHVIITKRGKAVATLGPATPPRVPLDDLFARMDEFRAEQKRSRAKLGKLKHAGHKY